MRKVALASGAVVAIAIAWLGGRALLFDSGIRANAWNAGDILTMLRNYYRDNAKYPLTRAEPGAYNVTRNTSTGRTEVAQNLSHNSWGQPLIYSSNGAHCTLVSPGRHGYQRATIMQWPEFDGPHDPDASMVFKDGQAVELALAPQQKRP
jgi:hypothetical protein